MTRTPDPRDAFAHVDRWAPAGVRVAAPDDRDYPANLRAAWDRPSALWWRGELLPADALAVAVAGTREPSRDGRRRARRLATALAGHGITVVSGLALGIDAEAHAAALTAGGRTIAVLGHGLDRPVSPRANAALADAITQAGALVSPFPPDTRPDPATFRARNATIAGLSRAAVVIEAGLTSGTRVLVRRALANVRPVLLAHSLVEGEAWARELVDRGAATPLDGVDDVLRALRPRDDHAPGEGRERPGGQLPLTPTTEGADHA
jgi:DNA processing protein